MTPEGAFVFGFLLAVVIAWIGTAKRRASMNNGPVTAGQLLREYRLRIKELQAEVERLREALDRVRITVESRGMTNKGIYVSMTSEYVGLIHKMAQAALKTRD